MKKLHIFSLLSLIVTLSVCLFIHFKQTPPDLTGYVIKKTPHRLLIQAEQPKNMQPYGGRERYYELIWVDITSSTYDVGDRVDVWYQSISQHYPRMASAQKMQHSISQIDKHACLTEKEVIKKALKDNHPHPAELFIVEQITFDIDEALWHINLYDVYSERRQAFTFDDHI